VSYHAFIDEWTAGGLDFPRGEQAAGEARSAVARLTGADARDIALIPSVSSAAGLVAAQFGPAGPGESIVIGQREYSSNHFPGASWPGRATSSVRPPSATADSSRRTSRSE
jgi:selenocysteine lyase/cysteine desulfurase